MVHHFAGDASITFSHKSLKKNNRFINQDFSLLVQLLQANRITLNTNKTEIILFQTKIERLPRIIILVGKKKKDTIKQTKFLCVYLDEGLTWKFQTEQIKRKLCRS